MAKGKNVGGAANSFHTGYLRDNMVGQNFKGSKVTNVTNKYIETENGSYSKKGLNVNFEGTNPDAGGYISQRRD
jgi:hypothetical protein